MIERRTFRLSAVKAVGETPDGCFTGKASVYGVVDSYGDVIMPGAFTKTLAENGNRFKVLNQHNPEDVIGLATLADSADALLVTDGRLELGLQSARDAYTRLSGGLIDAMSIGYETVDAGYDKGVRKLNEIKLWEVSLVTFPANSYARITSVKDIRMDDITDIVESAGISVKRFASILTEIKAGRAISASNEKMIRDIHESLKAAHDMSAAFVAKIDKDNEDGDDAKQAELVLTELSDALGKLTI